MAEPRITVVLPVRNGGPWIRHTMSSLLRQSRRADEVLVIDDGSTDDSMAQVRSFGDDSVTVLPGPRAGLAAALDLGIREASGELVARIDQDDTAHRSRLARQCDVFVRNPQTVLCGSAAWIRKGAFVTRVRPAPLEDDGIRRYLAVSNPFIHSSTMMRRAAVIDAGGYRSPTAQTYPEDYDLWTRMAGMGRLHNLRLPLVTYRLHEASMSQRGAHELGVAAVELACAAFEGILGIGLPPDDEVEVLRRFHGVGQLPGALDASVVRSLVSRIESASLGSAKSGRLPRTLTSRLMRLSRADAVVQESYGGA